MTIYLLLISFGSSLSAIDYEEYLFFLMILAIIVLIFKSPTVYAENPVNGYREKILGFFSRFWAFILGPLYYGYKGSWFWAVLYFFFAFPLWIILPFFNTSIVCNLYKRKGWNIVR